jgi:iron complex outermembrane recepter protein
MSVRPTQTSILVLLSSVGTAALITGFTVQPAVAVSGETAEAPLPIVMITAERREQSLQNVPISATVFSAEEIARKGVNTLYDLQNLSPSIVINTYNRSAFVNIRGVGIAQSAPTSNPGVAYYLDGVLIPHEQFIGMSFYDVGSIEVLRGPQGTLTGQNSTGGAIYVRTPEPVYGELSGYADQTVGNYNWFRSTGAINAPLGEKAAVRIAAVYDTRHSFTDNIGPSPSKPGSYDLGSVRANLAFDPVDGAHINLRAEYFDNDTDNNAVKNRNDLVTADPFTIEEDGISFLKQRGYRLSGEGRFDVTDGIQLRALTSWQDGHTYDQTDGDRTATALPRPPNTNQGRVSRARTDFKTQMNEVNLLSTDDSPLQWVVGGFYMDEKVPVTLLRDNLNTTDFFTSSSTIITKAKNSSESAFGQINYHATDQLELIAGARYSSDKQAYDRIASPGGIGVGIQKSNELTGRLGIDYNVTNDTMLYVTVSRGYKAGGVNLRVGDLNFLPEKNVVYEAGVKTTLADQRLRFNADVFYSDYKDIQLASLGGIPPLPITQNAASGEALGAEVEIVGAFDDLSFNIGAGLLNAQFAKDVTLQNTVTNANELVPKGRSLPFSPDLTLNGGIQYMIHFGDMSLTPRVQYSHVSKQYATPFPSVVSLVPSRDIVDGRLSFEPNESWRVEAFVTNLFDKTYILSQIQNSSSADGGLLYGAPRQYGVRATLRFD